MITDTPYAWIALSLPIAAWGLTLAQGSIGVFNLRSLSITKVFYWAYVARVYIPSIFVFLDADGPHKFAYLTTTTSVLVLVPLGAMMFQLLPEKQRSVAPGANIVPSLMAQEWTTDSKALRKTLLIGLGLCILLVGGFMLRAGMDVALFEAIRNPGNAELALDAREESFKLLPVHRAELYVYSWLLHLFLPFLVALTYVIWRRHRTWFWMRLFVLTTAVAIFFSALTIAKAPVAYLFIMLFVAHVLATGNRLRIRGMVIGAILVLAFPFFVQMLLVPPSEASLGGIVERFIRISEHLYGRLFDTTANVAYHYFAVPDQLGFLHGRTISLTSLITGEPTFDIAHYVAVLMVPSAPESASANGAFIGDLYANFGMLTVFLLTFVLGGIMYGLDRTFRIRRHDPVALAVHAFLIATSHKLVGSSVTTILLTHGVIPVFLVWGVFKVSIRGTSRSLGSHTALRREI